MKKSRDLLKEAFASMPNSFAYREVRFYLYNALQKLDAVEKKEAKRNSQQSEQLKKQEELRKSQSWQPPIYQNTLQVQKTLDIIDQMIADENKVIENINAKKNIKKGQATAHEDDEIQTFHG